MTVTVFGGGGSSVPAPTNVHDATGAVAHWTFDGTLVEAVTGGAGYDVSLTNPGYYGLTPALGASSAKHVVTNERQPGVIAMNAALQLTGDTTLAGWFCLGQLATSTTSQLFSAMVSGETSGSNAFWGLGISSADNKPYAYWETGSGTDQSALATSALAAGQWVHLTMTRGNSSDRCRLYVNGELDTETTGLTAHSGGGSVNQIVFGHDQAGTGFHLGLFSVVLFDSEKTGPEVLTLYNSTLA